MSLGILQRMLTYCRSSNVHVGLALLLAFVVGAGLFISPYWQAQSREAGMLAQIDLLNSEYEQAVKILAKADVEAAINRNAELSLRKTVDEQQQTLDEQTRLLEFYSLLMAQGKSKEGLGLNGYSLTVVDADARRYAFQFTFVQYAKRHRLLRAQTKINIVGMQGDQEQTIPLTELLLQSKEGEIAKQEGKTATSFGKLRFKYFQKIEGQLTLPVGFTPQQVVIDAAIKNKKSKPWQRVISWQIEG